MRDLAASSLAEQSSDIITTTWLDPDLRSRSLVLFDMLKARVDEMTKPFYANVRWASRRILTCNTEAPQDRTLVQSAGTARRSRVRQDAQLGAALDSLNGSTEASR